MNKATRRTKITGTLALLLALTLMTGSAAAFSGGDGSASDPYQISSCSEFDQMGTEHYVLINDIDCSDTSYTKATLGGQYDPVLNGAGYTVNNLDITGTGIQGLFVDYTSSSGAAIENITFSNLLIESTDDGEVGLFSPNTGGGFDFIDVRVEDATFKGGGYTSVLSSSCNAVNGIEIHNTHVEGTTNDIYFVCRDGGTSSDVTITDSSITGDANVYANRDGINGMAVDNTTFHGGGRAGLVTEITNAVEFKVTNSNFTAPTSGVVAPVGYNANYERGYIRNTYVSGSNGHVFDRLDSDDVVNVDQIYVAEQHPEDSTTSLFYPSGNTFSSATATYYDTDTTSFSSSIATGLTTSEMTGSSAETNMDGFDFVNVWDTVAGDYPELQTYIVEPPTIDSINSPSDGSSYLQNVENVSFSADVSTQSEESATVNFIVEDPSGTNTTVESFSQASGTTVTHNYEQSFSSTGSYEWYVNVVTSSKDVTESGTSFSINSYNEPSVDLWTPKNNSVYNLTWNENGNYKAEHQFNITIDDSVSDAEYTFDSTSSYCEADSGSGTASYTDTVTSSGTYDHFCNVDGGNTYTWNVAVDDGYSTFSTGDYSFETQVVDIPPQISNFDITPAIENISVGESFDLAVDGDVGDDPVESITYSMDLSDATNPNDVTITDIDFQNENSFNDQAADVFEYKEEYQGSNVKLTATVTDTEGRTYTVSEEKYTTVPPKSFDLFDPDNGEAILIPEGDTSTTVDFSYGTETDVHGGTLELIINGNVEKTDELDANTNYNGLSYQKSFGESSNTWKLKFTDSLTGEVYTSSTYSFEVTDEPFSLTLDSPSNGNTFKLLDGDTTNVDHNFTIDAQATNRDFYYQFELKNSSSGAVLESRTSQTLNIGLDSFTETVQSLGDGSYDWTIEIYMSSDDTLQESKTSSYTIVESPEYNSQLVEPYDGKQIYVDPGVSQKDVNASFTVETFKETVDTEFLYDGSVEDNRTISSQSDETVDLTLTDVPTGTHSVTLNAEDESGRTQSTTHSFEVLQEDEANVTLNELSTEPGLEELTPSDETFNIYFEAENKTEVEYVDVEVDVNGTTEHTIRVPKDELIIGSVSLLETVDLERDLGYNYNQLASSDISISATVVDSLQKSYRWSRSYAFGIQDPLPVQQSPTDGKKWKETDGSPEEHRLGYKIEMANEYVDYNVYVNDTLVKSGTAKETGDTFEGEAFVNVVSDLGFNQFGQFNWKVNISEQITGYETSTGTDTFQILNASETDVLLNFNSPEKNNVFTLKNSIDKKTVPFGFNYESEVAGTVKLKLRGDTEATLYNQEVESGSDTETFTEQLPEGEYTATLTYNKEGGDTVKEERFFTVQKEENIPEDRVFVDTPSIDERLYQSEQTSFSWGVNSSGGNGDTWYEIRDEDGNLAENYTESYEDYNELSIYGRNIGTLGLGVGEYDAQAFFKRDGDTVQESNNVSFTVVDFEKPELRQINSIENNTVYKEGEPINFSVESKTFDSPATATIKYRHVDDYESFNIAQRDYESFETATLEGVKRFDPGQYAWYVQYDVNPTFTTETQYFTVESSDIPEPEFSLNAPEQNQTIEIPSGDNSTNVTFDYDAEVFTSSDSEVNLLLSSREDGLTEFKQRATDIQVEGDGVQNYVKELDLAEDGYLYKVEVVYSNSTHTSDSVGFAVNDPETEETPEPPQPEDGEEQSNFLSQIIEYVAGFLGIGFGGLGGTVQIVLASLLTVLVGGIVNNWTESSEIGLMSMMVSIFIFVATGWLPAWIGIILFMLSAAIFIYALRRVHGGR